MESECLYDYHNGEHRFVAHVSDVYISALAVLYYEADYHKCGDMHATNLATFLMLSHYVQVQVAPDRMAESN